jgi:HD superfamily phosphohydrolase
MFKTIYDPVHGPMQFSGFLIKAIDTPEVQRLRYIKQLGTAYFTFPSATHTRFEHSLGVCYLAGVLMKELQYKQPELKISNRLVELVQLSGLCHDIGHGPFSHVFEDRVVENLKKNLSTDIWNLPDSHEDRSILFVDKIAKKLKLTDDEVTMVKALIHPKEKDIEKYKWITQIISDPVAGIDVDKFDYIARDSLHLGIPSSFLARRVILEAKVIDDVLAYSEKHISELNMLYITRYKLHAEVYQHRVTIAIDCELSDIITELSLLRPEWFSDWRLLTDFIIERVLCDNGDDIKHLIEKLNNIERRNLYKCVYNEENKPPSEYNTDRYKIIEIKYGYKTNPIKNLWVYNKNKLIRHRSSKIPISEYCEKYFVFDTQR